MFYAVDLVIPAGTVATAPAEERLTVEPGIITAVHVVVPPGVAGLSFTNCFRANHQLFPTNPGASITGDDAIVAWREQYIIDDEPRTLTVRGWSPAARFEHTITWRFEIASLDNIDAASTDRTLLRRIYEGIFGSP